MKKFRHGDVLIEEVKEIPDDCKKLNHLVLAKGEVTGHKHEVVGDSILYEKEGVLFLKVIQESVVNHEEHKTKVLPKGKYKVIKQREYEPEGWRNVSD